MLKSREKEKIGIYLLKIVLRFIAVCGILVYMIFLYFSDFDGLLILIAFIPFIYWVITKLFIPSFVLKFIGHLFVDTDKTRQNNCAMKENEKNEQDEIEKGRLILKRTGSILLKAIMTIYILGFAWFFSYLPCINKDCDYSDCRIFLPLVIALVTTVLGWINSWYFWLFPFIIFMIYFGR